MNYEKKEWVRGKFALKCKNCGKKWLVGDRDRSKRERKNWFCPDCTKEVESLIGYAFKEGVLSWDDEMTWDEKVDYYNKSMAYDEKED